MTLVSSARQPARFSYIVRAAWLSGREAFSRCPNCGCAEVDLVKRKYVFTALRRCRDCRILYRTPTDSPELNHIFYQETYSSGFTTDRPTRAELAELKRTNFRGSDKDFAQNISLMKSLGGKQGQRVLDFGASWGYGVWQMTRAGFEATGLEVSHPRAEYAREMLGVKVVERLEDVQGTFDVVIACHVLEHIPRPSTVLHWISRVLRPGGLFIALTPNGSMESMAKDPARYHRGWGQVHPFYIDPEFYDIAFRGHTKLLASWPYDLEALRRWNRDQDCFFDLSGWELLCAVKL